MSVYDFKANTIMGKEVSLADYKGKALLIVNVASKCVFTSQYDDLEKLYDKYKAQGFEVLGFPCNQFGEQEPASDSEIKNFCQVSFGVKFPMFSKVDVNGETAHPLFKYLVDQKPGLLGTKKIKWNFTKFLVDREGNPVKRYAPNTKPMALAGDIEQIIKK